MHQRPKLMPWEYPYNRVRAFAYEVARREPRGANRDDLSYSAPRYNAQPHFTTLVASTFEVST